MKKSALIFFCSFLAVSLFAQTSSNVLMTIDGREISDEEFLRIYNKNNSITSAEEKKDMQEYLDLFINYKLKVIEAENLGYDTMPVFLDEYNRYKEQLAKPYLEKSELKEEMVLEAFERSKEEIHASHILVRCLDTYTPEDTLKAYKKAMEIHSRVIAGEPFEEVARATSDDGSVKDNGGDLGWFSVFKMVYVFESACYNTKPGQIGAVIRSTFGYHIIKVHDRRENRGSVDIAHIMTRIPKGASEPEIKAAEEKINKAYRDLMNGMKWEDAVKQYSENPRTRAANGDIGWLTTGKAPEILLDECFALDTGKFTKPINTSGGFHIALIKEKKPIESLEESRDKIVRRIERDKFRKETIEEYKLSEINQRYKIEIFDNNIDALINAIDTSIYSNNWKASMVENMQKPVLKIEDDVYTQYDLALYLQKNKILASAGIPEYVRYFFDAFYSKELNAYAKKMLPVEYPEYAHLLQEYHDGILLFNLSNQEVWEKAQTDSVGLEAFYKGAKKYQWNKRITVDIYKYTDNSFTSKLPDLLKKQKKKKLDDNYIFEQLCPNDTIPCITVENKTFELGHDAMADKLGWEKGSIMNDSNQDMNYLYYTTNITGKQDKKLNESRGLYMADYQTHLENEWIKELRNKYEITINQELLEKLSSDQ